MASTFRPRVVVLGATHVDSTLRVPALPTPGETVVSSSATTSGGGKGANQAVAAAYVAGVGVHLVSALGDDAAGGEQRALLERAGVDTSGVPSVPGPSGGAVVLVADDGENAIVVVPGADDAVADWAEEQLPAGLGEGDLLVAQTEVGLAAVTALAAAARRTGARLVVNNGPALALPPDVLTACDPLVVNEVEAEQTLGRAGTAEDLRAALGCRSVVVTLGSAGCTHADATGAGTVAPAPVARVVDTTGAGDTFVGTLAAHLALGESLSTALELANAVAAESVGWSGARRP